MSIHRPVYLSIDLAPKPTSAICSDALLLGPKRRSLCLHHKWSKGTHIHLYISK